MKAWMKLASAGNRINLIIPSEQRLRGGRAILVTGLVLLAFYLPQASHCLILTLTGYPCPACGGTRAVISAVQGRFMDSLLWSPGLWLGCTAALAGSLLWRKCSDGKTRAMRLGWGVGLGVGLFRMALLVFSGASNVLSRSF